jgi:hypothetical protein
VPQAEGRAQDRDRRRRDLQGRRLLRDRLPERQLREGREGRAGAKPSETKAGKAPATPKASGDAPKSSAADGGAAAENRRIEARATHPSRIGRGIGNVVARNGGQAKGSSGGAKAAKPAAPAAKKAPPKSSSRKRG